MSSGDGLPPLTNLPLNSPSGDTGQIDLTLHTEVKSGQLEANQLYVAARASSSCGYVQVQFKCVKPYTFKPEDLGNEVEIISVYTSKDLPTNDCQYRNRLRVGESAHFHWPYFLSSNGDPKFGLGAKWKLYNL